MPPVLGAVRRVAASVSLLGPRVAVANDDDDDDDDVRVVIPKPVAAAARAGPSNVALREDEDMVITGDNGQVCVCPSNCGVGQRVRLRVQRKQSVISRCR